jgi:hypothetical protein
MDNLSRREIPHFILGAWFGWQRFRCGLGRHLKEMGVTKFRASCATPADYILPNLQRAKTGFEKTWCRCSA